MRALLLVLLLSSPAWSLAQWQWVDPGGRRVFSDQPPPPDIPARNILKQPGTRATSVAAEPPTPAAAAPALPVVSGRDKELEAKRKQAQADEAKKRKSEEVRIAKLRAENCTRAKQAKATMDSGIRLARVNDKGEREILNDDQRASEAKRLDEVIASECKSS